MDVYDREKIGKLIHWGSDHFVYNYGMDGVIKFSFLDYTNGDSAKALKDYETCKKYFGKHLLNTQAMISSNGKYIGKVQPKIEGHYLSTKDLCNPAIHSQFGEIMLAYQKMIKEGNPTIDLIGQPGMMHQCMSNIFVTRDDQLYIIDTTLIDNEGVHSNLLKIFFYIMAPIVIWRQGNLIKAFRSCIQI